MTLTFHLPPVFPNGVAMDVEVNVSREIMDIAFRGTFYSRLGHTEMGSAILMKE